MAGQYRNEAIEYTLDFSSKYTPSKFKAYGDLYVQEAERMSIGSDGDLQGLKESGRIVALALQEMARHLKPGITTLELDWIGEAFLTKHGARSAPRLAYNFPGGTCISINDEAAHGMPGDRVVQAGDLVNLDVSADLNGYVADTGATIAVPPVSPTKDKLLRCTKSALNKAIAAAQAGRPMNVIGQAVESEAKRCEFSIIANLAGHGVAGVSTKIRRKCSTTTTRATGES